MLELRDLHVSVEGVDILKGVSLIVKEGEVHAIMGPNGSGKSTLSKVIAGDPDYEITSGDVLLDGQSITEMEPEERAWAGIFMSFQYPVEIPGVSTSYFLKAAVNSVRDHRGEPLLDAAGFIRLARERLKLVEMDPSFLQRALNEGFSGGEKKRNEIFQMAMLEPRLAILDETDSGLDVDALRSVASGLNALRAPHRSMVVITHYQRLLEYLEPDFTHILMDGRIVKSGDAQLARDVEANGYQGFESGHTSGEA
jgi:Fe-S cluster assembly ATP-binding protein